MTAREAQAQAQVEGLTLARADSRGGFRNVSLLPATAPPPALAVTAERTATGPPAASEASLPDAASEAGSDCWAEAEVTAHDLVKYHPRSPDLVGADVCIMAAAYPKYTLTCSGAVGWRGTITHTRGRGSDNCRVRVLGSWFRLADKTLLRPIKQVKAKAAAKAEEAQAGASNATVRQAEAEGLTLQKSNNATGYRNVYYQKGPMGGPVSNNPFLAAVRRDGKNVHLGCFATAEEAALAVARTPEMRARLSKPNGGVQLGGEQLATAAAEATATHEEEQQAGEVEEGKEDEMELTRAAQGAAKGAAKGAAAKLPKPRFLPQATAASASGTATAATATATAKAVSDEAEFFPQQAFKQCGTLGCTLKDFHFGPCIGQSVDGPRRRRLPAYLKEAAEEEVWEDPAGFD